MDRKGRKTHTSICLGDKEKNHPFFSGQICNLDILRLFILERQGGQAIANFNTCKSRSTGLWCLCAFGFFSLIVSFGLQKVEKRRSLKILENYPGANSRKNGEILTFFAADDSPSLFPSTASAERFFVALAGLGFASAGGGAGLEASRPDRRGSAPALSEALRGAMVGVGKKGILGLLISRWSWQRPPRRSLLRAVSVGQVLMSGTMTIHI